MTLREQLFTTEAPTNNVMVYGSDENAAWIDELRKDSRITVSLSQNPVASLETLQFVDGDDVASTTAVHVVNSSTAERAIVQATNDALSQPEDTVIVLNRDDELPIDMQQYFGRTGTKVVFEDREIVDHILTRVR